MFSYLTMGANRFIQLYMYPCYFTKDQSGIYQLMSSLIVYLSIIDFGLSNTTTHYLSQAYAQHDKSRATAVCLTIGSGVGINWYYAHIGLDLKRFLVIWAVFYWELCQRYVSLFIYFICCRLNKRDLA